jgi:hypothetical protein
MTTPVVSLTAMLSTATSDESKAPAAREYRTKTSFVAVYFAQAGRGRTVMAGSLYWQFQLRIGRIE